MNFVSIEWLEHLPQMRIQRLDAVLGDESLSWAAKGLGAYLATKGNILRFHNTVYDGTMGALDELVKKRYVRVLTIKDW